MKYKHIDTIGINSKSIPKYNKKTQILIRIIDNKKYLYYILDKENCDLYSLIKRFIKELLYQYDINDVIDIVSIGGTPLTFKIIYTKDLTS